MAGARTLSVALAAIGLLATVGSTLAYGASPGAQTRGDAQAAFQAFFTGGTAIRAHNPDAQGAPGVPADPPLDSARIYPLPDGVEYCAEGWHVVMLGIFDDPALYAGGQQELRGLLSQIEMQFFLDGVSLVTQSTAIKRVQHPPAEASEVPVLVVNFGAFLPPGSLTLGTHELRTVIHAPPPFGDDDFTVSFTAVAC